jgi:hypothetical protein|eukprot:COSAG01_NODE_7170_length_3320_cov_2.451102_5_plen_39_part_00
MELSQCFYLGSGESEEEEEEEGGGGGGGRAHLAAVGVC